MSFRKITIVKREPVPAKDPAQIDLEDMIREAKDINVSQSSIVKWNEVAKVDPWSDNITGVVYAIGSFDPFGNNLFGLMIYAEQTTYAINNQMARVWLLNEDWSPQLNLMGLPVEKVVSSYHLVKMMGWTIGKDLDK